MKDAPKSPVHIAAPSRVVTLAHVHSSSASNVLMNTLSSKSDEDASPFNYIKFLKEFLYMLFFINFFSTIIDHFYFSGGKACFAQC